MDLNRFRSVSTYVIIIAALNFFSIVMLILNLSSDGLRSASIAVIIFTILSFGMLIFMLVWGSFELAFSYRPEYEEKQLKSRQKEKMIDIFFSKKADEINELKSTLLKFENIVDNYSRKKNLWINRLNEIIKLEETVGCEFLNGVIVLCQKLEALKDRLTERGEECLIGEIKDTIKVLELEWKGMYGRLDNEKGVKAFVWGKDIFEKEIKSILDMISSFKNFKNNKQHAEAEDVKMDIYREYNIFVDYYKEGVFFKELNQFEKNMNEKQKVAISELKDESNKFEKSNEKLLEALTKIIDHNDIEFLLGAIK